MVATKEELWLDLETHYPNNKTWYALADGIKAELGDEQLPLFVVDAGVLSLPSGALMICDPINISDDDLRAVKLPIGDYPVKITIADVSEDEEEDHFREAYATIIIDDAATEVRREIFPFNDEKIGQETEEDSNEQCIYVDTATAAFYDAAAFGETIDPEMLDSMTDDDNPDSWFCKLDDANHIRDGIANVHIAGANAGQNVILCHTGWGDGIFPIVGGYDASDRLIRVHVDFMVVAPSPMDEHGDEDEDGDKDKDDNMAKNKDDD
jgi:hypothetical protein